MRYSKISVLEWVWFFIGEFVVFIKGNGMSKYLG